MEALTRNHLEEGNRVLRYISGSMNEGIYYTSVDDVKLLGYWDSDQEGNIDDNKSTSRYIFNINSRFISWASMN